MANGPYSNADISIPVYRRRIYYADTDAGGVVHHSRYLALMEEARTEWLSAIDDGDIDDFRTGKKAMVVTATEQRYLKPIRLGQVVEISSRVESLGKVRLTIASTIGVHAVQCHQAVISLACVDLQAGRVCAIPHSIQMYAPQGFESQLCLSKMDDFSPSTRSVPPERAARDR